MLPFSQIIRKSIETVRTQKWLLIYGLVLGSTSSSVSSNSGFDSSTIESELGKEISRVFESENREMAMDQVGQVLGTATDSLSKWLGSVPMHKWIVLGTAVIFSILILIALTQVMVSWAYGGLIKGIDMAQHEGKSTTLLETSPFGIKNLKQVFFLNLRVTVYVFGGLLLLLIPLLPFVYLASQNDILTVFGILYATLAIIVWLALCLILHYASNFGLRYIVLESKNSKTALMDGYKLFRKNVKLSLVTSFINIGFSIVTGIVVSILTLPALLPFIGSEASLNAPSVSEMFVSGWIILIAVFVGLIINAALAVFIHSNWNQVYHKLNSISESSS